MSLPIPLLLAALVGLSPSAQAGTMPSPNDGNPNASQEASISTAQLRAYAAVVIALANIRSSFATRSSSLLPADRVALQGELDERLQQTFKIHDLNESRFRAIAAAIEKNPLLHRQVYQFEMDDLMGT